MGRYNPQDDLDIAFNRFSNAYHGMTNGPNFNYDVKTQLKRAAQDIITATESPLESTRIFAMRNAVHPYCRAAADCRILTVLSKSSNAMFAKQLAEKTGAD